MTNKRINDFDVNDVEGYECRHAVYCPPPEEDMPDIHLIKRIAHLKDGRQIPQVVFKADFKRKFYVEREGSQNHREKREFADIENLYEIECTQTQLQNLVRKTLIEKTERGRKRFNLPFPGSRDGLRKLARSPYLYGTDVSSTTLIKKAYQDMFPNMRSSSTVATTDTETNMHSKEEEIIMQTLTMKEKIFTVIKRDYFKGMVDVENRLRQTFQRLLAEDINERKLEWELMFVDTSGQIVVEIMKKAHEWKPDFLAVWNIKFDMQKMLSALRADGIDPAIVFSDPVAV